jgi:hypothetical protein
MQREDPDGWAEYLSELAEWELGTATTDQLTLWLGHHN